MERKKILFIFALALIALISMAPYQGVSAHGTGVSYEESKNGYKIDIGHDQFISALEPTRFDFIVYPENIDAVDGEVFTDVWVTFTQDKKLFFAGGIHKPVFGSTGFTYVFPAEGTYTVSARYQKDGETVVETTFPIDVLGPLNAKKTPNPIILYVLFALAGLVLGTAAGLFIPRKEAHKETDK
jgi:hypothetical protein